MKLTNYLREAFVRSVMQEIPKPDYDKLRAELQTALYAAMSADVRRVYRKNPKALAKEYTHFRGDRGNHGYIVGDADFKQMFGLFDQPNVARFEFQRKLEAAVKGFTTVKQLRDAYPELAHHLPDENKATASLPAQANLVAEMVALGWTPKGEAQQ